MREAKATDKKILRREMLRLRGEFPEQRAKADGLQAQARLLGLQVWREARSVLLYAAFRKETDTSLLMRKAWDAGKRLFLPRCLKTADGCTLTGELELAAVADVHQLETGAFGILEPAPLCMTDDLCRVDLAVLPGLAYDRRGFRLGYGGGYYDRLIATGRLEQTLRVGLCYGFQLLDALPAEPWDKPVHMVCTETEIVWT